MTDETPPISPEPVVPAAPLMPTVPPLPEVPPAVGAEAPGGAGAPRGRSKRAVALVAAAALVVGGGIGYAVSQDGDSGTKAGLAATPWTSPSPTTSNAYGAKSGGSHYGSLSLLLLPVPSGYLPGPDVNEYGNDVVLDAKQAQVLVRGDVSGLTKKQRDQVDATVAALHIMGAGLRTYTKEDGRLVVQMQVLQMQNKAAASAGPRYFSTLAGAMDEVKAGPKVAGHPQAACLRPSAVAGQDDVDGMICEATEGDLLVTMTVNGTVEFEANAAADLLSKQLDRIQDPGEAA